MGIPKKVFWLGLVFIALLPFIRNWRLLAFGEYTTGTVVKNKSIEEQIFNGFSGEKRFSVIEYHAQGKKHTIYSPMDLVYTKGKKLNIVYKKNDPKEYMIVNLLNIYFGKQFILPLVLLAIWLAMYFGIKQSIVR